MAPYVGDETELRDPPPQPTRLVIDHESVEGWPTPEEKVLRFPVAMERDARLSLRIGSSSEISVRQDDLVVRIDFQPNTTGESPENRPAAETVLEAKPSGDPWPAQWMPIDIAFENRSRMDGEIRLIVDGPLADSPGISIFWGEPCICYPDARRHKNVLLIGIDTLRADGIEPLGGRENVTPGLVSFAEHATLFTQARAQASWTLPSFASIVTGLLPSHIAPTVSADVLPNHVITLGEALLPIGYATATICGNAFLGNDDSGFHQGMESLWYVCNASPRTSVTRAQQFIERSANRDWFCFIHIMDPHTPYSPPQKFVERFCDPAYSGSIGSSFTIGTDWQYLDSPPPEEDIRRAKDLYDGEVANIDEAFASLFAWLDEMDLMDETLVIFTSDHGEEFYEHGKFEHGHTLYDELVRVPLIVHGPGFQPGKRIDACVGNTDIFPTILDYIGEPIPEDLPGVPLQDVVSGEVAADRVIYGEGNQRNSTHQKFAVQWPYKCVLDFYSGEARVYDLSADPWEMTDLSPNMPEIIARLAPDMVLNMLPIRSMYIVLIAGDPDEGEFEFSGTFRIAGGIRDAMMIRSTIPSGEDSWSLEGDTITFRIMSPSGKPSNIKAYAIVPEESDGDFEASLSVNGASPIDRFFPYGNGAVAPDGHATAKIRDFTWPAMIPPDPLESQMACYIIGIPGMDPEELRSEFEPVVLSPETREQLRALGYVN